MQHVNSFSSDNNCRDFITTPRRSPAVPNDNGSLALYTISTYSLGSPVEGKETRIMDLFTSTSTLFSDDPKTKDVAWLHDEQVLWLREAERGITEMWSGVAIGEKKYATSFASP